MIVSITEAHCLARNVSELLTVASPELLPALGREGWHAAGEHGDEGRTDHSGIEALQKCRGLGEETLRYSGDAMPTAAG